MLIMMAKINDVSDFLELDSLGPGWGCAGLSVGHQPAATYMYILCTEYYGTSYAETRRGGSKHSKTQRSRLCRL